MKGTSMKHFSLFLMAVLACASMAQAAPFTLSADGQEVTDSQTGLIWRRCAEGMAWDGSTCAGTASTFTHENALVRAQTEVVASGKAWRLPNVKELSSIVDRSRINPPIDTTAFPATPVNWFWSSSPLAGDAGYAWFVYFSNGYVGYYFVRSLTLPVRLVRAGQ
ncbi:MAG: DUF1566 domain-containing protein [Georgfuchsia sp.]